MHQNVTAKNVEEESRRAAQLGLSAVIVDDGPGRLKTTTVAMPTAVTGNHPGKNSLTLPDMLQMYRRWG